ncbi:FecR family protein [Steroidobacter flavus]|uniref:FecR family protein n=1 Tax=Steroidobacter flavus TaxID=1842136 RepID=A0ABV8T1Q4_9GAMM
MVPSNTSLQLIAREWVLRLADGDVTADDVEQLKAWRAAHPAHETAFCEARRSWRSLQRFEPDFQRHAATDAPKARATLTAARWGRVGGTIAAMAASILAVVILFDPATRMQADHLTGTGEIQKIYLPDGSRAVLNTDSAIDVAYEEGERRIELLRGEAWFEVRPDPSKPFIVHAHEGQVRAVGTAFSVRLEPDDRTTVIVSHGTVAISDGASITSTASVGERVSFGGRKLTQEGSVDIDSLLSWRERRVVIRDRPLHDAVAELDRYHRGAIVVLGPAREQRITGIFETDGIDAGLDGIAAARGLDVIHLTPLLTILR